MVDSRAKGARGEYQVRDLLRKHTGLPFERVPNSGALSYIKGDLWIPHKNNKFCIEVKNYQDSPFTDKIFTNKSNYLIKWWEKILQQAAHQEQKPLLFFKYSRSKVFVVTDIKPKIIQDWVYISFLNCYVLLAEEWLLQEKQKFLHD